MIALVVLKRLAGLVPWQGWALAGVLAVAGAWHWKETNAAYERGKNDEKQTAIVAAGKRIIEMEKTNEGFRALPARDRCLAFMRDSGLPAEHCN